jgi:hypothetical protein
MLRRTTRRTFVATTGTVIAGCSGDGDGGTSPPAGDGTRTLVTDGGTAADPTRGDADQVGDLRLTSPAFDDGDPIPVEYGRGARDVNPPLRVENVPEAAATLTLVMDDPDAVDPAGKVWLHWLVWGLPASTTEIPEDWTPSEGVEGPNDFGERGYGGPAPPDDTHTYRFKLYAVDEPLDLAAGADQRDVDEAMAGHVVARTQLTGTYSPQ